ncbi:hypothetical protein PINS_up006374 [Pythium insidiosum]|nr:hypothetical protein PINS_up006374 [Pythium insidiosum]
MPMSSPTHAAAAGDSGHDAVTAADTATLTLQDLENTSRNSKKKLYWSAFEAVLSTTRVDPTTQREELTETRLDAYHVNHHQLKKLHGSSRAGSSTTAVRVECKLCSTPRFTQSITVSTKKFEEHYMTHHALNALATADKSKSSSVENDLEDGESTHNFSTEKASSAEEKKNGNSSEPENVLSSEADAHAQHIEADADRNHSDEQVEIKTVDESRDRDGEGDGDAAGSSSPAAGDGASREAAAVAVVALSSAPGPSRSKWTDPTESDTKRAKKSYWTAYEVVISERVARDGGVQVQETRQDAWRVNHNALRRLHLDERNQTTVRVECRLCTSPKYTQSITVSTKKFELHVQEEHADDVAANHSAGADDAGSHNSSSEAAARPIKKRRKSWRLMLQDHQQQQQLQRPQPLDAPSPKKPRVVISESTPAPASAPSTTPLFTPPSLQSAPASSTAVLRWLVEDCLPLSFVDSPAFHAMMRVQYSSKVLQAQLDSQFEQAKLQIQQLLRDERAASTRFSLSLEQFSTHSGLSALAVSVHFISSQWQSPRHLLVACRQVPTPVQSNVEAVKMLLSGVLEELGLTSVIEAVTTEKDELNEVLDAIWPQPMERRSRRVTPVMPARVRCAGSALSSVVQAGLDSIASTAPYATTKSWTSSLDSLSTIASGSDTSSPSQQMAAAAMRVLTPFLRAATDLSDASFPSAAMVVTLFRHLRQSLEEEITDSDDAVAVQTTAMARAMQDALLAVYDRVVSTEAQLACVLDPRIRYFNVDDTTKATVNSYMEARMREELKRGLDHDDCSQDSVMADASAPSEASVAPATKTSASAFLDAKPTLFEELLTKSETQATSSETVSPLENSGSTSPSSAENTNISPDDRRSSLTGSSDVSLLIIRREIDAYLLLKNEPFGTDAIAWWQQHAVTFPLLSRLARHVLGAVASAQRCEQLFTVAGEERSARRRALESISLLEQLLISREWPSRETPSAATEPDTIACVV